MLPRRPRRVESAPVFDVRRLRGLALIRSPSRGSRVRLSARSPGPSRARPQGRDLRAGGGRVLRGHQTIQVGSPGARGRRALRPGQTSLGVGLFHAAGRGAADEVFLAGDIDDQDGQDGEHGAGHDEVPLVLILAAEGDQPELDVLHGWRLHVNDPIEEVVPHPLERQNAGREECRAGQRQDDFPEDPEPPQAVNDGRLLQIARNALEELRHQQDVCRLQEVEDHERKVGVDEVGIEQHDVAGNDKDKAGDYHRRDHDREQRVLERELQARERVPDQGVKEQVERDNDERDEEAVEDHAREAADLRQYIQIILWMPDRREEGRWEGDDPAGNQRQGEDDDSEHDRFGTGDADRTGVNEQVVINQKGHGERRLQWPPLRHDEGLVEDLEGANDAERDHQEDDGAQERNRDAEQLARRTGSVDRRRLVNLLRYVLQCRQEHQHEGRRGGPDVEEHDRRQRPGGALQIGLGGVNADEPQDAVQQPGRMIDIEKDHRDNDRGRNRGRVPRRAEEIAALDLGIKQHRQQEAEYGLQDDHHDGVLGGVAHRDQEVLVNRQARVVAQSDERVVQRQQVVVMEADPDGEHKGRELEYQEEEDVGSDEEQSRASLRDGHSTALRSPADFGRCRGRFGRHGYRHLRPPFPR